MLGSQIPSLFEPLEKRIETTRTDAVSVLCQFLNQTQTEDGVFNRMMQDVERSRIKPEYKSRSADAAFDFAIRLLIISP